ncbi:[Myosin heavy-chain] kinase protein [Dioscorea alata]|uniref:[Myosin heavy-chain] kinase protein n=1 Tax=Dioscorea alata TaxID=55571 RepID=A0ACB7VRH7_DIOAL|nr:[Myosin heavy-chain] kinase protein [Dioscorea alata]
MASPSSSSPTTPLLLKSPSSTSDSDFENNNNNNHHHHHHPCKVIIPMQIHKPVAILSGHVGSISSLALCGEFLLSASQSHDIIVWQHPDLRRFATFGHGHGSVKSLLALSNHVFTAHQDGHIRVWKLSRRSENLFRLLSTLPTTKDYLGNFLKQSNYVQTRRHHKKLWIQHADTISCLAVHNGVIYSGSWDKSIKVWRLSDFKCLESIKAHEDAINAVVAHKGLVYSASADGKIKIWKKDEKKSFLHCLKGVLERNKDVSWNSVIVCEDGRRRFVYGGGSDGSVVGWEEDEQQEQKEGWNLVCDINKAHEMAVLCLCSVGEMVCSGSADKSVGLWRRERGGGLVKVGVIRGHEGPVKCLQASRLGFGGGGEGGGGFMVYSGGLDKSLRVWWVSMESSEVKKDNDKKKDLRSLSY